MMKARMDLYNKHKEDESDDDSMQIIDPANPVVKEVPPASEAYGERSNH